MKISIELEFFEFFPPSKVRDFMKCLKQIEDGIFKYGKIELGINDGKITSITEVKHYEK